MQTVAAVSVIIGITAPFNDTDLLSSVFPLNGNLPFGNNLFTYNYYVNSNFLCEGFAILVLYQKCVQLQQMCWFTGYMKLKNTKTELKLLS